MSLPMNPDPSDDTTELEFGFVSRPAPSYVAPADQIDLLTDNSPYEQPGDESAIPSFGDLLMHLS